ncbi:MAG: hypothetical protein ACI9TV_001738 [Sulfurimonas sp.]|jgi:hypothetical protein|uniref:DUF4214 domain-containing protein n=1 Tax=Sulfurimonas sp. TaxID=2022749 RepID=UPI0039E50F1D
MNKLKTSLLSIALISAITFPTNTFAVTIEDKISGLYISFFNRAADEEGLTYWKTQGKNAEASGIDVLVVLKDLASGFATHPTFTSRYSSMGNEAFVKAIYINSLGQEGDTVGIAYWTDLINNGISRSDVVAEFIDASLSTDLTAANYPNLSPEKVQAAIQRQNLITNKVAVAVNFTNSLGILTNVQDSQNPENDPAYLASIEVLKDITIEASTATDRINQINDLRSDAQSAISIINDDWQFQHNNLKYSTISSEITGRTWLDRNIGARTNCTTSKDAECYGDYYQWGRDADGHEKLGSVISLKAFSSLTTDSDKFVISQSDWTEADSSGALRSTDWDICPTGYEVPTIDELLTETVSTDENILNIPLSGQRTKSGPMKNKNINGYLQSSTPSSSGFTKTLKYNETSASYSLTTRTTAAPVRCIKIPTITGVFVDAAVAGLNYTCSSGNSGTTNSLGEFTCSIGDTVSFSLGGTYLGEVPATAIVTPSVLFSGNPAASLNFAQLLQTLDSDGDPSNGIEIDEEQLASLGTIDFTSPTFDEDIQEVLGSDTVLVNEGEAQTHLDETFSELSIDENGNPTVPVTTTPTNTRPAITSSATASVNENQTRAIDIDATDNDGDTLIYSIGGTDVDFFNIDSSTGVVTFKSAPDFEIAQASYTFTALVSDGGLTDTQSVTILLVNVLDTKPTLVAFTTSIDEDASIGTVVGNITVTAEGSSILSFTLSDTTNFDINTKGSISTKITFDYENNSTTHVLSVYATNSLGDSSSVDVTISIARVPESAPAVDPNSAIELDAPPAPPAV